MKSSLLLLPALCLAQLPLHAQVTVVAPPPVPAPGGVVVQVVRPAGRALDPVIVTRQLSTAPRVVIVPTPAASTTIVAEPLEVVKTTKTTTVVDTPGRPRRVYDSERSVVVVQDQEQSRELPYVTLPVLFVKETSELLDNESRVALEQVAGVILAVSKTEAGTLFDIEGHTSTDGTDEFNVNLSASRAQRIYDELTQRYGVPANVLSAHGYGESFPMYPNGAEAEMQQDRRVLVVRTK
jgi:outer membrane protein OmpA-like peptidoglycan-associated protein